MIGIDIEALNPDSVGGGGSGIQPPADSGGGEQAAAAEDPIAGRIVPDRGGEAEDRAQPAGANAALQQRLAEVEAELGSLREALERSQRRRAIELALYEAEAIDVEAATLIAEAAIEDRGGSAEDAVARMKEEKPYLFRQLMAGSERVGDPFGGVMGAAGGGPGGGSEGTGRGIGRSAESARLSGDRRELLRYLRLRRGAF